jgi:hypothetical protein
MTHLKAVVTLRHESGLAKDNAVNTFHFGKDIGLTTEAERNDIGTALVAIYNIPFAGADSAISRVIHPAMSRGVFNNDVDFYEAVGIGGPFGSPIHNFTWTLGPVAAATSAYPAEVAITASFRADYNNQPENVPGGLPGPAGDTHPRARRRGRVFIGPLNTGCAEVPAGTNIVRPHTTFRTGLVNAMDNLHLEATNTGVKWKVYSPTAGTLLDVVAGWVDNEFDTMRSRQLQPTLRTEMTF